MWPMKADYQSNLTTEPLSSDDHVGADKAKPEDQNDSMLSGLLLEVSA